MKILEIIEKTGCPEGRDGNYNAGWAGRCYGCQYSQDYATYHDCVVFEEGGQAYEEAYLKYLQE